MIAHRALLVATTAATVMAIGLAIGNAPLAVIGLTLGGFVAWGLSLTPAGAFEGRTTIDRQHPRIGDLLTFDLTVACRDGWGPVLVHQPLPLALQPVRGQNVALFWKGRGPLRRSLRFQVRCGVRGRLLIEPAQVAAIHPLRFLAPTRHAITTPRELVIAPRVRNVPRVHHQRGRARLRHAAGDMARIGDPGRDFHELRNYVSGDPLHAVNWRATARRSTDELALTVNEYEPEGKKAVWLFLDGGAHMEVGSTRENSLDRVIEGALGLIEHYARRGHRIGATIYHQPETRILYPDSGTRQMMRLTTHLSRLNAHGGGEGLDRAVLRARGFLVRERPLVLLVTRPEADAAATQAGIETLRRLLGTSGRPAQILLLAPSPIRHSLESGHQELAVHTMHLLAKGTYRKLRQRGVRVLDWDPGVQPLEGLLAREVTRA